jgi:hypothetical protein
MVYRSLTDTTTWKLPRRSTRLPQAKLSSTDRSSGVRNEWWAATIEWGEDTPLAENLFRHTFGRIIMTTMQAGPAAFWQELWGSNDKSPSLVEQLAQQWRSESYQQRTIKCFVGRVFLYILGRQKHNEYGGAVRYSVFSGGRGKPDNMDDSEAEGSF